MNPYLMAVQNVARAIRSPENQALIEAGGGLSAFDAAHVLSLAFCKDQGEVLGDILRAYDRAELEARQETLQAELASLNTELVNSLPQGASLDDVHRVCDTPRTREVTSELRAIYDKLVR